MLRVSALVKDTTAGLKSRLGLPLSASSTEKHEIQLIEHLVSSTMCPFCHRLCQSTVTSSQSRLPSLRPLGALPSLDSAQPATD